MECPLVPEGVENDSDPERVQQVVSKQDQRVNVSSFEGNMAFRATTQLCLQHQSSPKQSITNGVGYAPAPLYLQEQMVGWMWPSDWTSQILFQMCQPKVQEKESGAESSYTGSIKVKFTVYILPGLPNVTRNPSSFLSPLISPSMTSTHFKER